MGLFSKKDKDKAPAEEGEASARARLFTSRSKAKPASLAPAASNPYAVQSQTSDPYASAPNHSFAPPSGSSVNKLQPPQQQQQQPQSSRGASPQPPAYDGGNAGYGRDKTPVPPGGYNNNNARFTQPDAYTQQQQQRGYGNTDAYGAGTSSSSQSQRPGGYGGLGRSNSQDTMATDAGREALFGGAKERIQQKQSTLPPEEDPALGGGNAYGGGGGNSYGGAGGAGGGYDEYGGRQLTAEEEEEEQVNGVKDQIRDLKRQDISSTRNALRIAQQAEETGRATLERLGIQGEMIHNAEKNLDLSSSQNRLAEDKARELTRLNRSIFAPNVANPFTKNRRQRERDDKIMEEHHRERKERDDTRKQAYNSLARRDEMGRELRDADQKAPVKKTGAALAERSKYQFEADSEDEAMEDEIDGNLDALAGAAGRLNLLGRAMGREVDSQNTHIERITNKVESVDDEIVMNRQRLDRISKKG